MRITVRVKPGAKRTKVGGRWGESALVVAVTAPAIEGKANEAVRGALAKAFGIRKSDVAIVTGHHGRDKIIEIPDGAAQLLDVLLAENN
jgi:uncharacterized protein (TIGR00251 family)